MRLFFLPILLIIGGGLASNTKTGNSLKKSQKKVTAASSSSIPLVPNTDSMIAEANSAFVDWQSMHVSKKSFKNKQERLDTIATTCLNNAKAASLLANGRGVIAKRHIELITGLWGFGDVAKESLKDCALNCPELLGCKVLFAEKVLAFDILLTDEELSSFPATQDRTREERFIVTLLNAIVFDDGTMATPEQEHFREFLSSLKTTLKRRKIVRLKQEEKEKEELQLIELKKALQLEQERLIKEQIFIEHQKALHLKEQQQIQKQREKEDLKIKSLGAKKKAEDSKEVVVENVQVVVEEKKKSPQSVSSIKSDTNVDVVENKDIITKSKKEVEVEAAVAKVDKGHKTKVVSSKKRHSKADVEKEVNIFDEFILIGRGEEGGHDEGRGDVESIENQGVATTTTIATKIPPPPPTTESSCIIC